MPQQGSLDQVTADILEREGYTSSEDFIRDMALWLALARKEQYKTECQFFEEEYSMTTNEFEQLPYSQKVDLLSDEDLKSWEFAASSCHWWEDKLEELQRHVGEGKQAKPPFEPKFGEILGAVARQLR